MESAHRDTFASRARPCPNSVTGVTTVLRYTNPLMVNRYNTLGLNGIIQMMVTAHLLSLLSHVMTSTDASYVYECRAWTLFPVRSTPTTSSLSKMTRKIALLVRRGTTATLRCEAIPDEWSDGVRVPASLSSFFLRLPMRVAYHTSDHNT